MNGSGNVTAFPGRPQQQPQFQQQPAQPPLTPFYPAAFEGTEPEPLRWVVPGLIPRGFATLFTGSQKLGKSYMLLHLLSAAVLDREWLGIQVMPCKVFALFCEDPRERLQWRLAQILRHYDARYADFEERFAWDARFGQYNALMQFHRYSDQGRTTPLWEQLWHLTTQRFGAQIVVIDTARQTFDGNENSAHQVTEFINRLNKLAAEIDGAVILTHHPPKSGMSEYAGTGAWAGAMRNHLHLARPKHFDPESREGWDERVLQPMNASYSAENVNELQLRWNHRAQMFLLDDMVPAAPSVNLDMFGRQDLDLRVMAAVRSLILDGSLPHAARERQSSLVALVRRLPGFRNVPDAQLWAAQDRLVEKKDLVRVEYGAPGNRRILLRPVDLKFPGES